MVWCFLFPYPKLRTLDLRPFPLYSDYNFVRQDGKCIPAGPEPILAGVCGDPTKTYLGSSGFRRIPGNTCDREKGKKKDEQVEKPCSAGKCYMNPLNVMNVNAVVPAEPAEGEVVHQTACSFICFVFRYHLRFYSSSSMHRLFSIRTSGTQRCEDCHLPFRLCLTTL